MYKANPVANSQRKSSKRGNSNKTKYCFCLIIHFAVHIDNSSSEKVGKGHN